MLAAYKSIPKTYNNKITQAVLQIVNSKITKSRGENVPSPSLFFLPFGKPILQNPREEIAMGVHAV